mgnify:FL=1
MVDESRNTVVALLAEGVDRNLHACMSLRSPCKVALLAEGVDRNLQRGSYITKVKVALLAEGVDRNYYWYHTAHQSWRSPSSQRAWIEIPTSSFCPRAIPVALLAEGVDRNTSTMWPKSMEHPSPSSRRAWIEILNGWLSSLWWSGRPPRGGRG